MICAPELDSLSSRLNYALTHTATKQVELARAIDVKPQIIQFLCNGKTKSSRYVFDIAAALGLNVRWLALGEGEMLLANDPQQQFLKSYSAIPLFDDESLKDVLIYGNEINQRNVKEWLPVNSRHTRTFGMIMRDESMTPHIPMNACLFIQACSLDDIRLEQFVCLYLIKFDSFIIRQLTKTDAGLWLNPMNTELYSSIPLNELTNVIGVVTNCYWSK